MQIVSSILGLALLASLYYIVEIYPHTPSALFSRLKREFRRVTKGDLGYIQFVISFKSNNLEIKNNDDNATKVFKTELAEILDFEKFVTKTLSNKDITLAEFRRKWETCPLRERDRMSNTEYEVAKKFYVKGGKEINVDAIYQYLKDFVWDKSGIVHPPKEELYSAIYNADFRVFMDDAEKLQFKIYPKILICHLRMHFEPEWYDMVCENLGVKKKDISGWSRNNLRAKDFDKNFPPDSRLIV